MTADPGQVTDSLTVGLTLAAAAIGASGAIITQVVGGLLAHRSQVARYKLERFQDLRHEAYSRFIVAAETTYDDIYGRDDPEEGIFAKLDRNSHATTEVQDQVNALRLIASPKVMNAIEKTLSTLRASKEARATARQGYMLPGTKPERVLMQEARQALADCVSVMRKDLAAD